MLVLCYVFVYEECENNCDNKVIHVQSGFYFANFIIMYVTEK